MEISLTTIGYVVGFMMPFTAIVGYFLARSRVTSPVIYGVLGFVLGLLPPIALIYLIMLFLKESEIPVETEETD